MTHPDRHLFDIVSTETGEIVHDIPDGNLWLQLVWLRLVICIVWMGVGCG